MNLRELERKIDDLVSELDGRTLDDATLTKEETLRYLFEIAQCLQQLFSWSLLLQEDKADKEK